MLIKDINDFKNHIPTSGDYNPNEEFTTYDAFRPFFEEVERWLEIQLLGKDLFALIEGKSDLKEIASRIVACGGYFAGIPYNDLVQTPNGFGVVSNSNQAPASTDRVQRLLDWTYNRQNDAIDDIIKLVFKNKEYNDAWKKFELYDYYTECFFMTSSSFRQYVKKNAQRSDLEESHSILMNYQQEIARMLSDEYMNHLIDARRNQNLSIEDISMIRSIMVILGLKYNHKLDSVYAMLESMVNTMVADLDKYPAYKDSETYKLKLQPKYENKKSDPTFFF